MSERVCVGFSTLSLVCVLCVFVLAHGHAHTHIKIRRKNKEKYRRKEKNKKNNNKKHDNRNNTNKMRYKQRRIRGIKKSTNAKNEKVTKSSTPNGSFHSPSHFIHCRVGLCPLHCSCTKSLTPRQFLMFASPHTNSCTHTHPPTHIQCTIHVRHSESKPVQLSSPSHIPRTANTSSPHCQAPSAHSNSSLNYTISGYTEIQILLY